MFFERITKYSLFGVIHMCLINHSFAFVVNDSKIEPKRDNAYEISTNSIMKAYEELNALGAYENWDPDFVQNSVGLAAKYIAAPYKVAHQYVPNLSAANYAQQHQKYAQGSSSMRTPDLQETNFDY